MDRTRSAHNCHDCAACNSRLSSVFAELGAGIIQRLNRSKVSHSYRRGQILHYEGNLCTCISCVRSGLVKVYKSAPHDRNFILHLAGPGDMLGLDTLITGVEHASTAEMLEDGIVCQIDRTQLVAIVQEEAQLEHAILRTVGRQLIDSQAECAELAAGDVRERLALTLLTLARKYGVHAGPSVRLALNLSREDLADMIGSTTETAIRHLSDLRRKSILDTNGRDIVIQDPERLARIARVETGAPE